jgi:GTP-binding protein Era
MKECRMFKSGFIAIIGKPNVGKSTLINGIVGEKIAITTAKPQTTRNRITGVKNLENGQLILVDTPGIHRAETLLNRCLVDAAREAYGNADLILYLADASRVPDDDDLYILEALQDVPISVFLVINKIDLVEKEKLLPLIDRFRKLHPFREVVPLSALKGFNVDRLLNLILEVLPEGPKYFPDGLFTDLQERFLAAEIIREKVTLLTREEIPYSSAVVVDAFKEDEKKNLISIQATINVEKESQKGILIGKKGSMMKEIGRRSRLDLENFFQARIFLELFVRVRKNWTRDDKMLREFGYSKERDARS